MSQALYPPVRPQSIAEVLDWGFRLFNASLFRCLPYSVLAMITGQLASIYEIAAGRPLYAFGGGDPIWWVLYVVGVVLTLGLWNAMMLRQFGVASGRSTSTAEEVRFAIKRLPLVIALLIFWVAVTALGLVLLVIPGLYLSVALVFAWPALVLKPMSLSEAIRYSLQLARRNWWRTTIVFSVAIAVLFVFYAVGLVFALFATMAVGVADVAVVSSVALRVIATMGAFAEPFLCALLLAIYADVQVRKESVDSAQSIAATASG
jgi:hypothetical protein